MNKYQSLVLNISKLQELKLDRDSIQSFQRFLRDPKTIQRVNELTRNYIVSVKGSWAISLVTASFLSFFTIPPLLSSISQSQQLIYKYKQELSQTPFLLQEVTNERERYELLEKNESQLDKFLLNSNRILFLPEVLRQSAVPHEVKLISFRPAEEDLNDEFLNTDSIPSEAFQDNSLNDDEMPDDEIPEDINMDYLDSEFMNDDSLDRTSNDSLSSNELSSISYSLQMEGDYIRMLSFLRDLQSYESLIAIQSARFSSSSSGSMDGSATNSSSTGSVLLDMVIQIPILDK